MEAQTSPSTWACVAGRSGDGRGPGHAPNWLRPCIVASGNRPVQSFSEFRLLARLFRVQTSVAVPPAAADLQSLNCSKQATRLMMERGDFTGTFPLLQTTIWCSCHLQLASCLPGILVLLLVGRFGVQTHPSKLQASACGVTVPVASGYRVPSFPATTTAGRRRLHCTRCRSQTPAFDGSGLICTSQPAPTPSPSCI